jgi:hypothetical protein
MGLNLAEITGPCFGETHRTSVPQEKFYPQFRFQLLNLTAQGWLGYSQALGCASEMSEGRGKRE